MTSKKPHVLVLGAGIGGLSAAIGLRKAGCTVEIHERAPQLQPVGAGITIQPNAMAALRLLGVGDTVAKAGNPLAMGKLSAADGTVLGGMTPADGHALIAELNAQVVGIHRATLHEILLAAAGPEHLHLGRDATRYELVDGGAKLFFADGSEVRADAVIGADGIHSVCRQQLVGDGEPVYAGYFCWRAIAPTRGNFADDWGGEFWGDHIRFGGCCIDGGRTYWFAVSDGDAAGHDEAGSVKATILAKMADYSADVRGLIEATPETAIFRSDIADRKAVDRWGQGHLTLLGDAAHAMTPNLGQGACQAIEDALVLGLQMQRQSEVALALRTYEQTRQPRVYKVVAAARQFGAMGRWHNPVARFFRDNLMKLAPSSVVKSQLAESWKLPYGGFE